MPSSLQGRHRHPVALGVLLSPQVPLDLQPQALCCRVFTLTPFASSLARMVTALALRPGRAPRSSPGLPARLPAADVELSLQCPRSCASWPWPPATSSPEHSATVPGGHLAIMLQAAPSWEASPSAGHHCCRGRFSKLPGNSADSRGPLFTLGSQELGQCHTDPMEVGRWAKTDSGVWSSWIHPQSCHAVAFGGSLGCCSIVMSLSCVSVMMSPFLCASSSPQLAGPIQSLYLWGSHLPQCKHSHRIFGTYI